VLNTVRVLIQKEQPVKGHQPESASTRDST
jgi:hypothetical protein